MTDNSLPGPGTLTGARTTDRLPSMPGEFAWVAADRTPVTDPRRELEAGRSVYIVAVPPQRPDPVDKFCVILSLRVRLPQQDPEPAWPGQPIWLWDGDPDRPTLNPSIRSEGALTWHGWLDRGQFRGV